MRFNTISRSGDLVFFQLYTIFQLPGWFSSKLFLFALHEGEGSGARRGRARALVMHSRVFLSGGAKKLLLLANGPENDEIKFRVSPRLQPPEPDPNRQLGEVHLPILHAVSHNESCSSPVLADFYR